MPTNLNTIKVTFRRMFKMANSPGSSSTATLSAQGNMSDPEKKSGDINPAGQSQIDLENGDGYEKQAPLAVLDWDGPDDPENPQNWPAWKRHFHVVPPAIISFAAYVLHPILYSNSNVLKAHSARQSTRLPSPSSLKTGTSVRPWPSSH